MNQEKLVNPKVSVFLFNEENPKGQIFKIAGGADSDEYKKLIKSGWFDTPAKLKLPEKNEIALTVDQVEEANPTHLIKILEKIGFLVFEPAQFDAKIQQLVSTHINIEEFTEEAFIAEMERRNLTQVTTQLDISTLTDEELLAETNSRGYINTAIDKDAVGQGTKETVNKDVVNSDELEEPEEPEDKTDLLINKFNEDPESLTVEELVELGSVYSLGLRASFKKETMIEKIIDALNKED